MGNGFGVAVGASLTFRNRFSVGRRGGGGLEHLVQGYSHESKKEELVSRGNTVLLCGIGDGSCNSRLFPTSQYGK